MPTPSDLEDNIDLDLDSLNMGMPKDLRWLLEFAENKRERFPNLKRIALMERCGLIRSRVHPTNWKLPFTIEEAFSRESIDFRAVMRKTSPTPTFD